LEEYIGDMYRPADYPELEGKEPEWVESEREMFKEHRDKDKDGKLNKANLINLKAIPLYFKLITYALYDYFSMGLVHQASSRGYPIITPY